MCTASDVAIVGKNVKFLCHLISSLHLEMLFAKNAQTAAENGLRIDFQINIKEINIVCFVRHIVQK